MMAIPLRSDPALAAVGELLGTLSVEVSLMWMLTSGTPSALLATYEMSNKIVLSFKGKY
jgi:hypothetical protein